MVNVFPICEGLYTERIKKYCNQNLQKWMLKRDTV